MQTASRYMEDRERLFRRHVQVPAYNEYPTLFSDISLQEFPKSSHRKMLLQLYFA